MIPGHHFYLCTGWTSRYILDYITLSECTHRIKRRSGLATILTAYSRPSAMYLYCKEIIATGASILWSVIIPRSVIGEWWLFRVASLASVIRFMAALFWGSLRMHWGMFTLVITVFVSSFLALGLSLSLKTLQNRFWRGLAFRCAIALPITVQAFVGPLVKHIPRCGNR